MYVEIGSPSGGGGGGGGAAAGDGGDNGKPVGLRGLAPPPFLSNTFDMVEDPKTDSFISWSSNGMSFIIWDHNKFAAELLPKYFRHCNLSSFVYQLNNYGFRKVNSERHEYENQWFRPGKKHWLKNIKSRVQKLKMGWRCGSFTRPIIDLEKGDVHVEMEKLRAEQLTLRLEIQKLKEQQENTHREFARVQGMGNSDNRDEERIISSFSQEFIQLVKEKSYLSSVEVTKKLKVGADNEGGNSSSSSGMKKKGDDELVIQPELQCLTSAKKSGTPVEGKMEKNARNSQNSAFWKKIFEDDSDAENGVGKQPLQDSKIMVELDDMMASKIAMEGESWISKVVDLEGDDEAHLELWT